ncbi:MAG: hypothetical protein R3279_06470 [Putridiphycobacter sp.]|nr:hypothetical protein [Putridiphycobacter sp.]
MNTEAFTDTVQAAGFGVKDALRVYEYIKQDARNIIQVYSGDINKALEALERMQGVAAQWFAGKEEMLCEFFVHAEVEVMELINEMGF